MNILQRIKDGAGKVTDRAQNAVEIGRLNTQISNIERELGLYFQRMGEVFFDGYRSKDMSQAEKEMLELAKTCDLLVEERDEIRVKIAELKNEKLCGACGKAVTDDAVYCQYCGHKLTRNKPAAKADASETKAEPSSEWAAAAGLEIPAKPQSKESELDLLFNGVIAEMKEEQIADVRETVDPEEEARLLRDLERERKRQEELDRRIRTWTQGADNIAVPNSDASAPEETKVATAKCQICSATLVKGTKWCPHCGSEQI